MSMRFHVASILVFTHLPGCASGSIAITDDGGVDSFAIEDRTALPDVTVVDIAMTPVDDSIPPDFTLPDDLTALADLTAPIDLTVLDHVPSPIVVDQVSGVLVATLAGSGVSGSQNGTGPAAEFTNPVGVTRASDGTLYVTEYEGSRVRTVSQAGATTTLTEQLGFVGPFAVVLSSKGRLLVQTDYDRNGQKGSASGTIWSVDRTTGVATVVVEGLARPRGMTALSNGKVVVADRVLETLSLLDPDTGSLTPLAGSSGSAGFVDGKGSAARFSAPLGMATLVDDSVIVADLGNHSVRHVAQDGTVTTYAGDGVPGIIDGPRLASRFDQPRDVAVDGAGALYISDNGNSRIRRIDNNGLVQTLAGDGLPGFNDGPGPTARFYAQEGIEVSPDGKLLFVADGNGGDGSGYHRVREISIP